VSHSAGGAVAIRASSTCPRTETGKPTNPTAITAAEMKPAVFTIESEEEAGIGRAIIDIS
jgi:hypothetical protein